jgi:hypothetical protein
MFSFLVYLQVYGGAISVNIGSYVKSKNGYGNSNGASGDTYCSDCTVTMSHVSIVDSVTRSNTSGRVLAALFILIGFVVDVVLTSD